MTTEELEELEGKECRVVTPELKGTLRRISNLWVLDRGEMTALTVGIFDRLEAVPGCTCTVQMKANTCDWCLGVSTSQNQPSPELIAYIEAGRKVFEAKKHLEGLNTSSGSAWHDAGWSVDYAEEIYDKAALAAFSAEGSKG